MKNNLIIILTMGFFSCNGIDSDRNIPIQNYEPKNQDKLVDIRTPEEFSEGHLQGAVNIDFFEDDFVDTFQHHFAKSDTIYIYCKSGGRSSKAFKMLDELGFKNLIHLDGGFMQWNGAGKPIQK